MYVILDPHGQLEYRVDVFVINKDFFFSLSLSLSFTHTHRHTHSLSLSLSLSLTHSLSPRTLFICNRISLPNDRSYLFYKALNQKREMEKINIFRLI